MVSCFVFRASSLRGTVRISHEMANEFETGDSDEKANGFVFRASSLRGTVRISDEMANCFGTVHSVLGHCYYNECSPSTISRYFNFKPKSYVFSSIFSMPTLSFVLIGENIFTFTGFTPENWSVILFRELTEGLLFIKR